MKKCVVYLLVIVFGLSMMFLSTGCKEGAAPPEGVEEEVATDEEEEVIEEAPTGEPKTIIYWSMWNEQEPQAVVIKQWIEDYMKVHPEITIDATFVGREILGKIMPARGGGEVIDLIDGESYGLRGSVIKEGQTLVLDDYLSTPGHDVETAWADSFIAGTVEQHAADDGTIQHIPYSVITNGFYYDKTIWSENGWTVPKTWDDFLAICEKIKTTSDIAPIAQDVSVDFYNDMWFYQIIERLAGPGKILEASLDPTGKSWEDPMFKKAIEMEQDLWDKGYFIEGALSFTWPSGQEAFASGEAAMELCGSWLPNELKNIPDEGWEWGSFEFPRISGGIEEEIHMESYLIGWVIFKDTKVAPEIIDFLKFCATPENAQKYVDESWNISSINGVNVPPAFEELGKAYQQADVLFNPHDSLPDYYPGYFNNVYLKNHDLAFKGMISPDEFVEVMKEDTINWWENN